MVGTPIGRTCFVMPIRRYWIYFVGSNAYKNDNLKRRGSLGVGGFINNHERYLDGDGPKLQSTRSVITGPITFRPADGG